MPNIWFDVTTTIHWRRPPVGIVRVEAEIFKYLVSTRHPNVRFCHFDKKRRSYHEVSAGYVMGMFNLHGFIPPQPEPPPMAAKRAVAQVKKAMQFVPDEIRTPVVNLGKKSVPLLRTALHHGREAANSAKRMGERIRAMKEPVPTASEGHPVPLAEFGPGDVLISAGLDWDQKDLGYLYQLKLALGLKVVLFCYDLIPVLFPHLCVGEVAGIFARYFVDVAWCADEILCISKSSQRDLLAVLREAGAPEPATSIIRLGSNLPTRSGDEKIEDIVKGDFLLFVSTIERRKNHEVIYRAMAQLADQGRKNLPTIVFVGMVGWGVNDFLNDIRIDWRTKGKFMVLNHVSDAQLSLLYKHSLFTLYPSLYEGWGLPLAESLAHGKFCIASNTSSLPEVGGPLVDYIDPWESRRWAERIGYYLDHPEELKAREEAIVRDYHPHQWEETGSTVFQLAERLLWQQSQTH